MDKMKLSFPQKNIWLVEKFNEGTNINSIVGTIEIKNGFDTKKCNEAINEIIKNNDALRLKFVEEFGNVFQILEDYEPYDAEFVDFSDSNDLDIVSKKRELALIPLDIFNNETYKFYILKYTKNSGAILMKIHHLVCDAWSCSNIGTDIASFLENGECEKRVSYKEFLNSEDEYVNSEKYLKDKDFWNEYLDGIEETVSLKETKENIKNEAKRYSIKLSKEENDAINSFCKENRVSVFSLFLGALSTYIYRIKGKNDFVIGTPILNRSNFKEKQILGMFISTIPLRIKIEENQKFIDVVKNISSNTMNVFRHQKYPYSKILEDVRKNTNLKDNLYNVILSYQNARAKLIDNDKYSTSWIFNEVLNDQLQIHVTDMDNTGNLVINYDYLKDAFENDEVEYIHTRLMAIIKNAIKDIDIDVENIDIMSDEEKNKIIYEFNNTTTNYPKDKTVIELFEEQVTKTPDNVALVFEDKAITYKELNEKSNMLAHYLRYEKNINPNDKISLILNRGIEMIITIYAVLKSSAAYIPIDVDFPDERKEYMINNSDSKLVIKSNSIDFKCENCINIDDIDTSKYSKENLEIINRPDDLIYMIYTSGTTGKPKGVMIKHKNVANLAFATNDFQKLNECNTVGAFSSYSFDISIFEIMVSLINGKKVIIANELEQKVPEKIYNLIKKQKIEVVYMTPTRMQLLLNFDKDGSAICNLKRILLGGEIFPVNFYEKLRKFTNAKIYDGYGPTEITVWSSAKEIQRKDEINIGYSIPNVRSYILDKKNRFLPIMCEGELCIAGAGVAEGYYKNEKLTKEKFINKYNQRIYKTGDIAKFNKFGELEFLGRVDNQIKLHGLRIEIDEIENSIKEFEDINQAVVVIKNERIYAYFSSNVKIEINDLKKYLRKRLPIYMIPLKFIQVDKFEFTVLGKIDKSKLPEIDNETVEYVKPRNSTDLLIFDAVTKILNKDSISIEENLFEAGLDSINSMSLLTILKQKGIDITYGEIYDYPTIKELSDRIISKKSSSKYNEIKEYDYSKINKILKNQNNNVLKNEPSGILLLGATGFLGIHILEKLLLETKQKVYCMIRKKDGKNSIERMKNILNYYFDGKYVDEIGKRIIILEADISDESANVTEKLLKSINDNFDTVINTASRVTHFGEEKLFMNINLKSSNLIAKFCLENKKKLIYISTLSVSGNSLEGGYVAQNDIKQNTEFTENDLYLGQNLNNIYIYSKFLAERALLEYVQQGLDLKIIRIGNLTCRTSDYKFQLNKDENAFANRIKTLLQIKVLPENLKDLYFEFTPVDVVAEIILKMAYIKSNRIIYHIFNHNHINIEDFIEFMKYKDINIKFIDKIEFSKLMNEYLKNKDTVEKIKGILIDLSKDNELNYITNIKIKSDITLRMLEKLDITWPKIDKEYIYGYIDSIMGGKKW